MLARAEIDTQNISLIIGEPVRFGDGTLHAPTQSHESLQELGETIVNRYLKHIDDDAPGVCMDGRACACMLHGQASPILGPKSAGGPLQTAFGAAETVDGFYGSRSAIDAKGRIAEVADILTAGGIVISGHTTSGAVENGFKNPQSDEDQTGCGAAEKHAPAALRLVTRDANVMRAADRMLGSSTPENTYVDAETLSKRTSDYSPKLMLDAESDQSCDRNAEVLGGEHEEVLVFINDIEGTTVDRDKLIEETGKQVFVIDAWYIKKIARAMTTGRPDSDEMYPRVLRAAIAYQFAVYAELGDGSHPVLMAQAA